MKELIHIETSVIGGSEMRSVSAKELYLGFGLALAVWARWADGNIVKNDFFIEHKDWEGFNTMLNGNETKDYAISLEFAKHIAMMAKTEKAHEYRNYFLECERLALHKANTLPTPLETARMLVASLERQAELEAELEAAQPSVQLVEELTASDAEANVSAAEANVSAAVKLLFNGSMREKEFRQWLRDAGWPRKDRNEPAAWAIERGLMRVRTERVNGRFYAVPVLTAKGIETARHHIRKGELFTRVPGKGIALRLPEHRA